jgi:hypothetical protein
MHKGGDASMLMGLLWIAGVYGCAVVVVYAFYKLRRRQREKPDRLLIYVTRNSASHIEWYIRMLPFLSGVRGRRMSVMILDEGSEDETVQIVQKIAMKQGEVSLLENNAQLERILENLDGSSYHIEILDEEKTRRQTASM